MEPSDEKEMGIESLPNDMLQLIVCKVASSSSIDFCNARLSCKSLKFDLSNNAIAASVNLSPWVKNPKKARNFMSMIDSCLKEGNLDAHYIKGVIEYFDRNNKYLGLHHLQVASRGGHAMGSYLFGVLLMCLGRIEKGKKVINNLANSEGILAVQQCWGMTHGAVREFPLSVKDVYAKSYASMKPEPLCHPTEFSTVCSKCFHYFLMSEFFELLLSLDKINGL